jgi:hypothetical protein
MSAELKAESILTTLIDITSFDMIPKTMPLQRNILDTNFGTFTMCKNNAGGIVLLNR